MASRRCLGSVTVTRILCVNYLRVRGPVKVPSSAIAKSTRALHIGMRLACFGCRYKIKTFWRNRSLVPDRGVQTIREAKTEVEKRE